MVGSPKNSSKLKPIQTGTLAGKNHVPTIKSPKIEPIQTGTLAGKNHATTQSPPVSANKKRTAPTTLSNVERHLQELGESPEPGNKNFRDEVGLELETTEQKRPAEPYPTTAPAAKKPKTETKATQDELQKIFKLGFQKQTPNASMADIEKTYQKHLQLEAEKKPVDKSI
ncbi:MAG: hypothetical protein ACJARD_000623 [Alphaproteobacteria bacterium]|jgi:hypothetical protein